MRKIPASLLVALPLSVLGGCVFAVDDPASPERADQDRKSLPDLPGIPHDTIDTPADPTEDPTPPPAWDDSLPFTAINGGRFTGAIGSAHGLDLPSDLAFVYDDGSYNYVEVYALRSDGNRVMLAFGAWGDQRFFKDGLGLRMRPGYVRGFDVTALGCEGPDSGIAEQGYAFADTPYDEEPCETSVEGEQDPEHPGELMVTLSAVFAEDCDDVGTPPPDGGEELPDPDGDGDGDLPTPGGEGGEGGDGENGSVTPLTATATFRLTQ